MTQIREDPDDQQAFEYRAIGALQTAVSELQNAHIDVGFTIGAEAANVINVGIQLLEGFSGDDVGERRAVLAYLSDDANGDSVAATAPSAGVSVGTDGVAIPIVADKAFLLVSEADGDIDLDIEEAGADTWYLIVVAGGQLHASTAITFA